MTPCKSSLQTLRQRGFRLTPQREMIVQALVHSNQHLTAEQIFEQVRLHTDTVNIATIYRTLDLLVQQGIAARAALQDGQIVYTAASHGEHIHLVCRRCGAVTVADPSLFIPLAESLQVRYGFKADHLHFSLTGLCRVCQADLQKGDY